MLKKETHVARVVCFEGYAKSASALALFLGPVFSFCDVSCMYKVQQVTHTRYKRYIKNKTKVFWSF